MVEVPKAIVKAVSKASGGVRAKANKDAVSRRRLDARSIAKLKREAGLQPSRSQYRDIGKKVEQGIVAYGPSFVKDLERELHCSGCTISRYRQFAKLAPVIARRLNELRAAGKPTSQYSSLTAAIALGVRSVERATSDGTESEEADNDRLLDLQLEGFRRRLPRRAREIMEGLIDSDDDYRNRTSVLMMLRVARHFGWLIGDLLRIEFDLDLSDDDRFWRLAEDAMQELLEAEA